MKARYILILLAMLAVVGCKEKVQEPSMPSIYGLITDRETGKPLENASVTLKDQGLTVVTGQEGAFRFDNLTGWSYTLLVEKTGYESVERKVELNASWVQYEVNIPLEAGGRLQMLSAEGTQLTKLDFSDEKKGNSRSISVVNPSRTNTVRWWIEKSIPWIKNVTPNEGTLDPEGQVFIVVKVDRGLLDTTLVHGTLHLKSESYSKSLTVVAKNEPFYYIESLRLMVQRKDLGSGHWEVAEGMCKGSSAGGYNDWRLPTTVELAAMYGEKEAIGGFAENGYYWTSQVDEKDNYPFCAIIFSNGEIIWRSFTARSYVRAVRSY